MLFSRLYVSELFIGFTVNTIITLVHTYAMLFHPYLKVISAVTLYSQMRPFGNCLKQTLHNDSCTLLNHIHLTICVKYFSTFTI